MMRVGLLLLLVIFAIVTVPPLRAWAEPVIDPVAEALSQAAEPVVARVRQPIYAWSTRKEVRELARDLHQRYQERRALPDPIEFTSFLGRTHGMGGFDRWGGAYYLQFAGDSVVVGSPGPDGTANTPDDIREGFSRIRH
jgi:hypothetical protein